MMKLAVVAPPQQPELALLSDGIYLCQAAWVLQYEDYAYQYAEISAHGGYVIMDWQHIGADAEHITQSFKDFYRAVEIVNPKEVIIPDKFKDATGTLTNFSNFVGSEVFRDIRTADVGFMFIPQGKNLTEWTACLRSFEEDDRSKYVEVIGIPKVLDSYQYGLRAEAAGYVQRRFQIHYLGVWGGIGQVVLPLGDEIRSLDTSLPVAAAQHSRDLNEGLNISMKWQLNTTDFMCDPDLVLKNVDRVKKVLGISG